MARIEFGEDFAQALPLQPAFLEGAEAHKAGIPFALNPYAGTAEAADWSNGWEEAEYAEGYWNEQ